MSIDEKTSWNKKYGEGSHRSLEPDPLLESAYEQFLSRRAPGLALDVGGGAGRHAIWLAERGWRLKLLDISEVGINLAQKNAGKALGSAAESLISAEVRDLNSARDLGHEEYDVVLVFYYLQRELFPALISALKPGGVLVYKTYTTEPKRFSGGLSESGPSNPMFLLEPNELLSTFRELRILHYHETIAEKGLAELVAMK